MGKLKTFIATAEPPKSAGGALMPMPKEDLGSLGSGLSTIGQGLISLGKQWQEIKERTDYLHDVNLSIQADSIMDVAEMQIKAAIESEPDPAKWEGLAMKITSEAALQVAQLPVRTQQMRDRTIAIAMARQNSLVAETQLKMVHQTIETTKTTVIASLEAAYGSGDPQAIQKAELRFNEVKEQLWSADVAKLLYERAVERGKAAFIDKVVQRYENQAATDPDLVIKTVNSILEDPSKIDPNSDEARLQNTDWVRILNYANSVKVLKERELARQQIEEWQGLVDMLDKGTLTIEDIKNSNLSETGDMSKLTLRRMLEDKNKGNDPTKITDYKLYLDLQDRITGVNKENPISDISQIAPYVGRGLSQKDYEFLKNLWKDYNTEGGIFNSPAFKNGFNVIKQMEDSANVNGKEPVISLWLTHVEGVPTREQTLAELQAWAKLKNDFIIWARHNPNATPEQIQDQVNILFKTTCEKYAEQKAKSIWGRIGDFFRSMKTGNDNYKIGEKVEKDGKIYTYKGNDLWEYD